MAQDPITLARGTVEAFNEGDFDRLRDLLADDSAYDEPGTQRHVKGADAIVDINRAWKEAFPDARGTVTNAVGCGDSVAVLEITWEGTQSGPLRLGDGSIPASNRRIELQACEVVECKDGKVTSDRHYFDMLGMLEQIGSVSTEQLMHA